MNVESLEAKLSERKKHAKGLNKRMEELENIIIGLKV